MALALEHLLHVPYRLDMSSARRIVIPLVTYGAALISQLQNLPNRCGLFCKLLPFIAPFPPRMTYWRSGWIIPALAAVAVNIMYWGAAAPVLFALVAQIGEQVDYLRFMPEKRLPRIGGSGGRIVAGRGRGGCYWVPLNYGGLFVGFIWPLGRV